MSSCCSSGVSCFFLLNYPATTEIYTYGHTLSLHDALPSYEQLPVVAAVPGTGSARRYLAPPAQPKYYASYDLETLETFGSAPWLAVRATDWSSRVRPSFVNTKRTMFRRVSAAQEN